MRIIAGKLKGAVLYLPPDKNTRPLKDIARESIVNLLIHSKKISLKLEESIILDIYPPIMPKKKLPDINSNMVKYTFGILVVFT